MRHLWSLLAGVVVAPLTWALVALAQDGSTRTVDGWLAGGRYDTADLVRPACYLAAAAILVGLLATLRISPLGPAVAGLALAAPYVALFVDPLALRDAVPANWSVLNQDLPLLLPVRNGTLGLIGVLLLMAVFSGHRWRRWPSAQPPAAGDEPRTPTPEPDSDVIGSRPPAEPAPAPAMAGVGAGGDAADGLSAEPVPGTTSREHTPSTERLAGTSRLSVSFRRRPASAPHSTGASPEPTSPAPPAEPAPASAGPVSPAPVPAAQASVAPVPLPRREVKPEATPSGTETSGSRPAPAGGSPWSAPPRPAGRSDDQPSG